MVWPIIGSRCYVEKIGKSMKVWKLVAFRWGQLAKHLYFAHRGQNALRPGYVNNPTLKFTKRSSLRHNRLQ